jgi:hypothetical protein
MTPTPVAGLDLRDIHAAAPAEFWPPAPGWWLLAALLAAALACTTVVLIRGYRRRRQKLRILAGLAQLESTAHDDAAQFTAAISALLRRVALMRYARTDVASLSGAAWLQFLDATGGNGAFVNGPGSALATAPYAPHPEPPSRGALLALARAWIEHNLGKRP